MMTTIIMTMIPKTTTLFLLFSTSILFSGVTVHGYNAMTSNNNNNNAMSRRSMLRNLVAASGGAAAAFGLSPDVAQADTDPLTDVYFGVGCFWHAQHEFIAAERDILGRDDQTITALSGYAGGTKTDNNGRVCYHNLQFVADYGKYGHGEVVGMKVPESKIGDFAKVYFDLFRNGGEWWSGLVLTTIVVVMVM